MMNTSNGSGEQVSVSVEVPERSGGTSTDTSRPDPEVLEKAKRRQFSAEYKLGIVEEANACQEPGQIAALLRREGLYSSLLSEWRRARREGLLRCTPSDATRCTLDVIECTRGWHRSVPSAPHVWNAGTG